MRESNASGRKATESTTGLSALPGAAVLAALVAGCAAPPPTPEPPAARPVPPVTDARPAPRPEAPAPAPAASPAPAPGIRASAAATPRDYRRDAAQHLYGLNRARIYPGRMPPMLYAIGVLQVEVDANGQVRQLSWMRAPRHAPEVIAEIERTVRAAAPFPAPARIGSVTYTDTWLWDRSGRFQLDTLTEGQN
ncbi:MAG: hypothetical protein RIS88_2731 [Pseudomonadota bacterium]|jgi:hypothetical protein